MTEIKFCENNFEQGTEQVADRLQSKFADISIEVEPCLGYCGECAEGPFALVDNDFVQADTPEDLYEEIVDRIERD